MGTRNFERYYPFVLTVIIVILYGLLGEEKMHPLMQERATNLLSVLMTLSSVMISFVGVILGVVISLAESTVLKILERANAIRDLLRYIKVAFFFDIITLALSVFYYLTKSSEEPFNKFEEYIIIMSFLLMLLTSIRVICILFEFANIDKGDKDNIWNKPTYTPKNV